MRNKSQLSPIFPGRIFHNLRESMNYLVISVCIVVHIELLLCSAIYIIY